MAARCSSFTRAGKPCRSGPLPGRPFCYVHDPELAEERRQNARTGGVRRSNTSRARRELERGALTPKEVRGVVGLTMKSVLSGRLPPAIGGAIAALARVSIELEKLTELSDRVAALEAAAGLDTRRIA